MIGRLSAYMNFLSDAVRVWTCVTRWTEVRVSVGSCLSCEVAQSNPLWISLSVSLCLSNTRAFKKWYETRKRSSMVPPSSCCVCTEQIEEHDLQWVQQNSTNERGQKRAPLLHDRFPFWRSHFVANFGATKEPSKIVCFLTTIFLIWETCVLLFY